MTIKVYVPKVLRITRLSASHYVEAYNTSLHLMTTEELVDELVDWALDVERELGEKPVHEDMITRIADEIRQRTR